MGLREFKKRQVNRGKVVFGFEIKNVMMRVFISF